MSSPNQAPTHEQVTASRAAYELIDGLEPERNAAFTAIDQIGGSELAKSFLTGYAEVIAEQAPDDVRDRNPIDVAMGNISAVAGYYITGNNPDKTAGEQFTEILAPWTRAYEELTQQPRIVREPTTEELDIAPLTQVPEQGGFTLGGVNSTDLIRKFISINKIYDGQLDAGIRPPHLSSTDVNGITVNGQPYNIVSQ